jgi:putative holliday junction resolvase
MSTASPPTTNPSDFALQLPKKGRLCGLDVGDRRIGIAFCDREWQIASATNLLQRGKLSQDVLLYKDLFKQQDIVGLVIGLPLNLDGSASKQTQATKSYARQLSQQLNLPILLWDERWSTIEVERTMIAADVSRAKRAEKRDSAAAALILQGAIDKLRRQNLETR